MSDVNIDQLLVVRRQMEADIQKAIDSLAGKRKAMEALSTTIDLLRGWRPEESSPPKSKTSYDAPAIVNRALEFLLESSGPRSIREICKDLEEAGLTPTYSDAVRTSVTRFLRESGEVDLKGIGPRSKYLLKAGVAK